MSNLKTQLKHNYEQLLLKKKSKKPYHPMRNTRQKKVFGKQVENGGVCFITFFFFKPKQFTEAILSMKKTHNEDVQRLGEITNSLEEIKFKLTKLKKGLGEKKRWSHTEKHQRKQTLKKT